MGREEPQCIVLMWPQAGAQPGSLSSPQAAAGSPSLAILTRELGACQHILQPHLAQLSPFSQPV